LNQLIVHSIDHEYSQNPVVTDDWPVTSNWCKRIDRSFHLQSWYLSAYPLRGFVKKHLDHIVHTIDKLLRMHVRIYIHSNRCRLAVINFGRNSPLIWKYIRAKKNAIAKFRDNRSFSLSKIESVYYSWKTVNIRWWLHLW